MIQQLGQFLYRANWLDHPPFSWFSLRFKDWEDIILGLAAGMMIKCIYVGMRRLVFLLLLAEDVPAVFVLAISALLLMVL